ncbi:hypothetical protein BpHYR1_052907 [Brachionus plicatilis]|uniref:Uncharacterized protein n=1 Tax=Brachionus plicatilis TaxID=10195 RepID=A0A3M7QHU2_BRAPC|nr:hypothetical protein BpHYR1_052907 [Brachionus plicatilis]
MDSVKPISDAGSVKIGYGHGHGLDLNKGNISLKNTQIASCYSIGSGCGHGKCFFKKLEELYSESDIEYIDSETDEE